jgi:hypothetical protein
MSIEAWEMQEVERGNTVALIRVFKMKHCICNGTAIAVVALSQCVTMQWCLDFTFLKGPFKMKEMKMYVSIEIKCSKLLLSMV